MAQVLVRAFGVEFVIYASGILFLAASRTFDLRPQGAEPEPRLNKLYVVVRGACCQYCCQNDEAAASGRFFRQIYRAFSFDGGEAGIRTLEPGRPD